MTLEAKVLVWGRRPQGSGDAPLLRRSMRSWPCQQGAHSDDGYGFRTWKRRTLERLEREYLTQALADRKREPGGQDARDSPLQPVAHDPRSRTPR